MKKHTFDSGVVLVDSVQCSPADPARVTDALRMLAGLRFRGVRVHILRRPKRAAK